MFGMENSATATDSPRPDRRRGRRLVAAGIAAVLLAGSAAPAFAHDHDRGRDWGRGWHGDRGWHGPSRTVVIDRRYYGGPYYGRSYYGHRHHGDGAALFGLGAVVGLATGAILAAPPAPRYYAPPPVVYAPPPAYGGYGAYDSGYGGDGYCREYQRNVYIGGTVQRSYGTACLQPDGSWRTVSEGP
jgi:hypothetical protein